MFKNRRLKNLFLVQPPIFSYFGFFVVTTGTHGTELGSDLVRALFFLAMMFYYLLNQN